jgi:hypothetical protein
MPLKRPCQREGATARLGWLPVLGTRGFHRPLSDPRADLRLRFHGSERDGRNVPLPDLRRQRGGKGHKLTSRLLAEGLSAICLPSARQADRRNRSKPGHRRSAHGSVPPSRLRGAGHRRRLLVRLGFTCLNPGRSGAAPCQEEKL